MTLRQRRIVFEYGSHEALHRVTGFLVTTYSIGGFLSRSLTWEPCVYCTVLVHFGGTETSPWFRMRSLPSRESQY